MKNILILAMFILAILYWVDGYVFLGEQSKHKNSRSNVDVSAVEISVKQFDIEDLAHILGVNYTRIVGAEVEAVPDNFDITVSLISIHISGGLAKARLRVINEKNETLIVDAEVADSFNSLELIAIHPTYIELKNNGKTYELKMYKPQVISITTTKSIEEVENDS